MKHRPEYRKAYEYGYFNGQTEVLEDIMDIVIAKAWDPARGESLAEGYRNLVVALDDYLGRNLGFEKTR